MSLSRELFGTSVLQAHSDIDYLAECSKAAHSALSHHLDSLSGY